MEKDMVRQGDILVRPRDSAIRRGMPVAPEAGRIVLAHGEATGHHHSIALSSRVAMFREDGGGGLALAVQDEPALLEHQEHAALTIAPGVHDVIRQRSYSGGLVQRVAD